MPWVGIVWRIVLVSSDDFGLKCFPSIFGVSSDGPCCLVWCCVVYMTGDFASDESTWFVRWIMCSSDESYVFHSDAMNWSVTGWIWNSDACVASDVSVVASDASVASDAYWALNSMFDWLFVKLLSMRMIVILLMINCNQFNFQFVCDSVD